MIEGTGFFVGGAWAPAASESRIPVVSPATQEQLGTTPCAGPADVDAAVAAAREAADSSGWAQLDPAERAEVVDRLADAMDKRAEDRALLVSTQNGMPINLSTQVEGMVPGGLLRYYAALARATPVEEHRPRVAMPGETLVRREPVGVVAAVVPWNAPTMLTMFKLAPALAAGCTVVIKSAPEVGLEIQLLADALADADVPPGVVNLLTGDDETGRLLVAHPGVDRVAFTGSSAAGRHIGEVCGARLRPVSLELGGKSAAIVLDDVDLDAIAENLSGATLLNNGQYCYLSTRILAPARRFGEVLDAVTDMAASLVVGNPLDPGVHVGPLISSAALDRVQGMLAATERAGGTLTTGGSRPSGMDRGWYLDPTVFAIQANTLPIAREEIFGPVLVVLPYEDESQAVALANDSDYGLAGTVWTSDLDRGVSVARAVHTGTFGVNGYLPDVGAPFGGTKASGIGRELGPEGLAAYQRLKTVYLPG